MNPPIGSRKASRRPWTGTWRIWRRAAEALAGCLLAACLAAAARAEPPGATPPVTLPPAIAAALSQAGIPDTHVGLFIQALDAPAPQLAFGEQRAFNPASVMKLVTTLAALDRFGPAHTWHTEVLVDGEVRDGVLAGNLILRGGGDPGLSLERFWLLLREVRARGVRRIQGDVILDNGFYSIEAADPGAFDQSPSRPYNAQPSALLISHNALGLRLKPAASGVEAALEPPVLDLDSTALKLLEQPCNDWLEGLRFSRHDAGPVVLEGGYPLACGDRHTWVSLLSGEAHAAAVFGHLWQELGGGLSGRVRAGLAPTGARILLAFPSVSLGRLVLDVNEFSNNVMAKMLFLNLGAAHLGQPATWDKGNDAARAWLLEQGLCLPELVLENGSGLSRNERISAASLARLLRQAASRPVFHEFVASLPILGREGTLKSRLADTTLAGRAWLKTGSLNGTRGLAGYLMDTRGRMKVFVMLVNTPQASQAVPVQNAALAWAMSAPEAPAAGDVH